MRPLAEAVDKLPDLPDYGKYRDRNNLPFSEWGPVFPDPRLVAAIVDRITFNAHIIETGTESYRLRTSTTNTRRKRAN